MGTTAALAGAIADELDGGAKVRTLAVRARRSQQRRQMLDLIGLSYVIDACILLIYAYAGTVPTAAGPAFAACGLITVAGFIALSESGISERFRDHYCVVQQATVSLVIMLAFAYAIPQVGFMFLCTLFVVFSFSSLRSTARQTAVVWTVTTVALAGLFMLTDRPFAMPFGSPSERLATALVFALTIGRCMYIGMLSSKLRDTLYKRGLKLKEAYERIEQLAELDELTGSFNRRCIMRMLDSEIMQAERTEATLSVALIDLDLFKQINDTHGHPTGDEVLRTFAITIFANIRNIDKFGRYGGEEFLLVMPNTSNDEAVDMLERLRAIVAELDWSAFSVGMSVTISAGVATLAADESPDAILARADNALYAAKNRGRNRIASA
ncbi:MULTISPECIES: GGDEF domain-containing protein [Rhodopseudomonas]|uniref:diguanylate cyclase n=1 Tax=Rhodopseudomonas palustris TaxID=1076 RepID=A0A0D7EMH1_RHOPL|nr:MULTISPECIES: GGDEF domain-containing protein [Rhodopseudomonas]KIZ40652.1 diguanylate cyclase [Rhodopseudomonas palustris]MDF3808963.1 GGDEF domain-containing protein [Rhodopseudomonas sp. BAL398]WOK20039.1 GGDEF domain-containing protein [Rhodopseudomonas sp. BAL398]